MINKEELVICRRRGHAISILDKEVWARCKACGIWVREVRTIEEREDTPPKNERNLLLEIQRKVGLIPLNEPQINPEELVICKRRGHATSPSQDGWEPCSACGTWLRETRTIEERETKPPDD
jgi:hypothetical protein